MLRATHPVLAAALLLLTGAVACRAPAGPEWGRPLPDGAPALLRLGADEPRPSLQGEWYARADLLPALDHSIDWMHRPSAADHFPVEGVTHARARASLERFRELLVESASAGDFERAVQDEFDFFRSAGWDGRGGGVLFTGYCTPILDGSAEPDDTYRYPLYGVPEDLVKGPEGEILGQRRAGGSLTPYPTRGQIERGGLLTGTELVWLADPVDAYIAHVNGSAIVRQPDGSLLHFGYGGNNGREYASLRATLVASGEIGVDEPGLPAIRAWAARSDPGRVAEVLAVNPRYVFFQPIDGTPHGSLNVPVTTRRTLATDKALFPRGGLVLVDTRLPDGDRPRARLFRQLMLDQDTGGAIRTAGRADLYLGQGDEAEDQAGITAVAGQMYYLFLKDGSYHGRLSANLQ